MGLDMYLFQKKKGQEDVEVGYWRKANAIHNWFVKNVQNGNDDCKDYAVSREDLQELKDTCEKVLKSLNESGFTLKKEKDWQNKDIEVISYLDTSVAEKLLPTQGGFFFGSTTYDNYYKEDLEHTIEICDKCLNMEKGSKFYYNSWW